MSADDPFRRAQRTWSSGCLHVGQRVRIVKGQLADARGCLVKNCGGGRWAISLDGLGDRVYVIMADDLFDLESEKAPATRVSDERQ
jgi:hypothetical protein